MKMRLVFSFTRSEIGSILAKLFVVIAMLACNSNAASVQPSATRQKSDDLEVITFDLQGNPANTVYYSYDQLLTLPTMREVTVQ
jgi:hypothetical protein